jgi:patatin-like phospholipase/acyl hydrolase
MKSPIRIIAIDGGGVGGIIPARILEHLNSLDPRVLQNADLIAGTSTGGLIALGLGNGLSPTDLCNLYQDHVKDIFSSKYRRILLERPFRAKFEPTGLQIAVQNIVGDQTLGELTAKSVLVPVTAVKRPDAHHQPAGIFVSTAFRLAENPRLEKYGSSRWKCLDVALATAAAPTYFPAHEVTLDGYGHWLCWDGGVVANNPGLAAVGEIFRLDLAVKNVAVRADQNQLPDVRVLSLGTGYRNIQINAGDWGAIEAARPVISALMDTSVGSTAYLLRQILGQKAVRVSVPLATDYEMDDPGVVDGLNAAAQSFCQNGLQQVVQPDESIVNVLDWLSKYWF